MIKLDLETNNKAQEQIKQYLEENASEVLAEKINNGVKITKDNKSLINKKDLDGFWKFATEEARKNAEKGANGAYVDDETVFSWAIHYFEEDSIEGTLYNEDGTEYKVTPPTPKPKTETKSQSKKPENNQATLFDLFSLDNPKQEENEEDEQNEDEEEFTEEEQEEAIEQIHSEQQAENTLPEPQIGIIEKDNEKVVDTTTGEILSKERIQKSFDKETMYMLYTLLDGKMDMR